MATRRAKSEVLPVPAAASTSRTDSKSVIARRRLSSSTSVMLGYSKAYSAPDLQPGIHWLCAEDSFHDPMAEQAAYRRTDHPAPIAVQFVPFAEFQQHQRDRRWPH